jgi:triphosphatase
MDAILHQSSGAMELELKFALEPGDVAKLKGHRLLAWIQPTIKSYVSTYFDTADHALGKAGLSLRLRAFDDHAAQTLKLPSAWSSGLLVRSEYETELIGAEPDLDHLRRHCPAELHDKLQFPLASVFRVEVQRTEWLVHWKESAISLVLDEGCIKQKTRSEPVDEIEVELRHGRLEDVFDVARQLAAIVPLRLEVASKADRGYRLTKEESPQAEKAGAIKLDRKATAAAGFQTIASLCIHHFAANERLFLKTNAPEALHQMRVAVRRLRSLMSFFETMLSTKEMAMLRLEIGRVFKALGAARDLDVLLASLETEGEICPPSALAEIRHEREVAYMRLTALLNSRRFCLNMLDLLAFVECGVWMKAGRAARGAEKLNVRAALILKRQREKLRKFEPVSHLEAKKRHKLRIQAKKFRYACEFFGDLFAGPKAHHRKRDMSKTTEDLQELLGQLNDRVFRQERLARWAGIKPAPEAAQQQKDEASEQDLIKAAESTQVRLEGQKRFWS